ncbi:MAG: preprotein translocase subunit SecG [Candidatus Shapirobacteria bacterium]|jgi:protein translocase SecG subunit|nr:preprotein translocase subunit SecG [Candidatus Shapirobacteria bacterium]
MKTTLTIVQILLAVVLSILIFLQSSGETESNSNLLSTTQTEKRGWEKIMFNFTIFVIIAFIVSSIVQTTL